MNHIDTILSYRDGMTFSAEENTTPTSMYIADVNKLMLVVVNRFLLMTEDMMSRYLLDTLKLQGMNTGDLGKELRRMARSNFLTVYHLSDCENNKMLTVFGLGYRGRGYLKSIQEAPRMTGYLAQVDAYSTLKILAANQYLVKKQTPFPSLQVCKTILAQNKNIDKTHLIARPQGLVCTAHSTQLLEAVRRTPDYLEKLNEKLGRMQLLLDRDDLNVAVPAPSITLICEDGVMLEEIRQSLSGKRYFFPIYATTDAWIAEESAIHEVSLVTASGKGFLERLRNRLFYAA